MTSRKLDESKIGRQELSQAAHDFLAALERLENGSPTHPELKARVALGTFVLSFTSVALEANRSRTLIGHRDCALPEIRKRIQAAIAARKKRANESLLPQIKQLRETVADLRLAVQVRDTVNARLLGEIEALEKKLARERERTIRNSNRVAPKSNVVPLRPPGIRIR